MKKWSLSWSIKMAWRDSRSHRKRFLLFLSSVIIGIAALVAIGTFAATMEQSINEQSKTLLGADLVLSSRQSFPPDVEALIKAIGGKQSRQVSFASMVYFPENRGTRLVQVRALTGDFPYYGTLQTVPESAAKTFRTGLYALVDENLLFQFEAEVGDLIQIGALRFRIAGRLQKIPGEIVLQSDFAPRVYIPFEYLEQTKLIQQGSRVSYRVYFHFPEERDITQLVKSLQPQLTQYHLRYETVETRKDNLGDALANLYRFLNLGSFIALLVGSIGVASSIHTYVKQKLPTIAVLRSLGALAKQTFLIYLIQATAMGMLGSILGVGGGIGIVALFPRLLADFLPLNAGFALSGKAIIQGMGVGVSFTMLFALLPLLSIRQVSPLFALRKPYEEPGSVPQDPLRWLCYGLIVLSIALFAHTQTKYWGHGLWFTGGIGVAFVLLALVAKALMYIIRRYFPFSWSYIWRQGLANLYRPHNQTVLVIVTLGLGTCLITTLYLTQTALFTSITSINSTEQPNMVLIDIQRDQQTAVAQLLMDFGMPLLQQVPIVPMRIAALKGKTIAQIRSDPSTKISEWALLREYRSTYRAHLADTETLVAGQWQHTASDQTIFISVEEEIAQELGVQLGDEMVFDVQGIPIRTKVGSLRAVDWQRVSPNFFVVFPPGVLEYAPQFHVFVTRADSSAASAAFQRALVTRFPNVSVIDLQLILTTAHTILDKVALVIRTMAFLSILTGIIVLTGVIVSGRYQRVQESVLLRTLGATRRQVQHIMILEYLFLGSFGAITGLLLAVGSTWALTHFVFEVDFTLAWEPLLVAVGLVCGLTITLGILSSKGIHNSPPLEILRAEI